MKDVSNKLSKILEKYHLVENPLKIFLIKEINYMNKLESNVVYIRIYEKKKYLKNHAKILKDIIKYYELINDKESFKSNILNIKMSLCMIHKLLNKYYKSLEKIMKKKNKLALIGK
jgi:hypothetical protein